MPVLVSAVVLLGALGLLNLALTFGIVRRLNAESARAAQPAGLHGLADAASIGATAGPFSVTAADGSTVTRDTLATPALVAFFAPGCPPCAELLPEFTGRLREDGPPAGDVLAVVTPGAGQQEYVDALAEVATVVTGDQAQDVVDALGVGGFPVVARLDDDGTLHVLHRDLREMARPVPA
ncbi:MULTISPECIES: hypothetical protein [Kitasatospora]|uniref:Thioredoxin domain-containing protein n=1 Tax=Kitasatospora arboriphila TaxID=258052 RepID=A0ABN1TYK3_9ACTN